MKEGTLSINCPGELCPKQLEYNEIKEFADRKTFSKHFISILHVTLDTTNFFVEKSTRKTPTSDGARTAPVQLAKSSTTKVSVPLHIARAKSRTLFPLHMFYM